MHVGILRDGVLDSERPVGVPMPSAELFPFFYFPTSSVVHCMRVAPFRLLLFLFFLNPFQPQLLHSRLLLPQLLKSRLFLV